jgi:hypothetical protein
VNVKSKKCEGCGLQRPSFGLPAEGKMRWCGGCAKAHAGAVNVNPSKKCEGCGLQRPSFGLPAEGKMRWCGGCAEAHAGSASCRFEPSKYGVGLQRNMAKFKGLGGVDGVQSM